MPDVNKVIEALDRARSDLNAARNVAEEWRRGKVAGVTFTAAQLAALRAAFATGLQTGKNGLAAVDVELRN